MKFTSTKTQYNLIPESVDAVSEKVGSFLGGLKIQRKNIISKGFDGLFLQLELVRQAEKYNMLDKKTLEK
ncbi:MAG TPA: hypothetical protein DCR23_00435 [Ruminococcaceae bacterium]|nr:hypothetical protein [Oscillospiraceae bacterium]